MKDSTFKSCIKFFNSFSKDEIITRKDLIKSVAANGQWTRDTYRNLFFQAGYLEKVGAGKYKLIYKIPENMTTKQITKEAYSSDLLKFLIHLNQGEKNE